MAKNFIYTITTGRSGTGYLASLLRANLDDAVIYHERANFLGFGVHSPDASDFTYFNTLGNVEKVQRFWQRKLALDKESPEGTYAEASHVLVKAGLVENLNILSSDPENQIHLIILKRDINDIAWSLYNRFDFANTGFVILWDLDYRYQNVILSSKNIVKQGMSGSILWYIHEMFTRAAYYQLLLSDVKNITFHEVDLQTIIKAEGASKLFDALNLPLKNSVIKIPPKINHSQQFFFPESERKKLNGLCDSCIIDHHALAKEFYDAGRRLASPQKPKEV